MLTFVEAQDVVIGSIKKASGADANPTDKLEDVGFPSPDFIRGLRSVIVNDEEVGVKQFNHKITSAALSKMKPSSTVDDVAQQVRAKATPIEA